MDIRYHTANDYAALRDMEGSDVATLDDADRACLDALGRHLVRSGACRRFGVALLHRHFLVADDELLVETGDVDRRTVEIKPHRRDAALEAATVPFTVRFADPARPGDLIGLEYMARDEAGPDGGFGADCADALAGLHDILSAHGKLDRFGIRTIHHPVRWTEDEVLFEESDVAGRVLSFEVGQRGDPRLAKSVETFWVWERALSASGDEIAVTHCPARCERICVPTGLGHDKRGHDSHGHGHQTGITQ